MKTMRDALIEALVLAVTAPSDQQSERAVHMAEQIATRLSATEVESAKRAATRRLAKLPYHGAVIASKDN